MDRRTGPHVVCEPKPKNRLRMDQRLAVAADLRLKKWAIKASLCTP